VTNAPEYFTRTNLIKIKMPLLTGLKRLHFITPVITYEPYSLALYNSGLINVLSKYNLQTKAKALRTTHHFVPVPNNFFLLA